MVLICFGALISNPNVSAAGEGKISGTVKLDGTAPHMRGIDMSKDPYCVEGPRPIGSAYWHFVDSVWMFVVPLVYLMNLSH